MLKLINLTTCLIVDLSLELHLHFRYLVYCVGTRFYDLSTSGKLCASRQNERADIALDFPLREQHRGNHACRAKLPGVQCADSYTHCVPEGIPLPRHDRHKGI